MEGFFKEWPYLDDEALFYVSMAVGHILKRRSWLNVMLNQLASSIQDFQNQTGG